MSTKNARLKALKALKVLGIETSCDETACAIVELNENNEKKILAHQIYSQIDEHSAYGGVVPEIAARAHIEILDKLTEYALQEAQLNLSDLDGIAATAGPGLIGGLIVGLTTGKALAHVANKPFLAINHLEAHALTARFTDDLGFPFILLLVSGGHTQLLWVSNVGSYELWGTTIDDAIGEAFDKTAKMLDLGYPGGPKIEALAKEGNPQRFAFPRPLLNREGMDFSLSGLKTAVRQQAEKLEPLNQTDIADICASFQAAIIDILQNRVTKAIKKGQDLNPDQTPKLVIAGGVAANKAIRESLSSLISENAAELYTPPANLCTDNGVMIAWAGLERLRLGQSDPLTTAPKARWPLSHLQES